MQLTPAIALHIVERASSILPYPVNVMDECGIVIGSSDESRLHRSHKGALLVLQEQRAVEVDSSMAKALVGVKQGINLPIRYRGQMIGVVGLSGEPQEVRYYAELVKMTAEMVIEQAALVAELQWDNRHREKLLQQLLGAPNVQEGQLATIAERLTIDLRQPRLALILKVSSTVPTPLSLEAIQALIADLEHTQRDALIGLMPDAPDEIVLLVPAQVKAQLWDKSREEHACLRRWQTIEQCIQRHCDSAYSARLTVGHYYPGLDGLKRSYLSAQSLLFIATSESLSIQFYHQHTLAALVASLRQSSWHQHQLVEPIERLIAKDRKGVLLHTLRTYFEHNEDAMSTCQMLDIHKNTLRYRLEKVEVLTDKRLSCLEDKVALYLALQAKIVY
ncbi:helix-turn-helix domain-containing protein [Vibrio cholerae]